MKLKVVDLRNGDTGRHFEGTLLQLKTWQQENGYKVVCPVFDKDILLVSKEVERQNSVETIYAAHSPSSLAGRG